MRKGGKGLMFGEELLCWQVLGMLWGAEHPGDVWVTVGAGQRQSCLTALQGSAEAKPPVRP